MSHSLDIFQADSDGRILWRGSADSLEAAKAWIQKLAASAPGEYLILDQHTGERVLVSPDSPQDAKAKFSYLSFLKQS
jgi:hypothetical protein